MIQKREREAEWSFLLLWDRQMNRRLGGRQVEFCLANKRHRSEIAPRKLNQFGIYSQMVDRSSANCDNGTSYGDPTR